MSARVCSLPAGRAGESLRRARARASQSTLPAVARRCALARMRAKLEVEFARQSTFSALVPHKSNSTASERFGSRIAPLASPTWALPAIRPRLSLGSARGKSASLKDKAPVDGSRCLVTGGAPNPKRRSADWAGAGSTARVGQRRARTASFSRRDWARQGCHVERDLYGACSAKAQTLNPVNPANPKLLVLAFRLQLAPSHPTVAAGLAWPMRF